MPDNPRQSFCDVIFNNNKEYHEVTAQHFSGVYTRARRKHPPKQINRDDLRRLIDDYWKFVDKKIRNGVVDGDDSVAQQALLDELKTFGSEITKQIFSKDAQREIWKAAAESDIFVISTNLEEVPWEALFSREYGERGSFLSDDCVIQRQLESDQELAVPVVPTSTSSYIVCLDPILAQEEDCAQQLLERISTLGVTIHRTSTKDALETAAREARVIHWICEHAKEGLRIANDVFYSHLDVDAHRFPMNCVLFMLSCGAGRYEPKLASLSASIAAASGCTVVAPSSVVATKAAVRFMIDIDTLLRGSESVNLSAVWSRLKNPPGGRLDGGGIKPGDCYLLWFGIYGDCNVSIRCAA